MTNETYAFLCLGYAGIAMGVSGVIIGISSAVSMTIADREAKRILNMSAAGVSDLRPVHPSPPTKPDVTRDEWSEIEADRELACAERGEEFVPTPYDQRARDESTGTRLMVRRCLRETVYHKGMTQIAVDSLRKH